ncbi:MAG: hypothetical protein Q9216_002940 [Gyalolechia sp. 2 TL-2023]
MHFSFADKNSTAKIHYNPLQPHKHPKFTTTMPSRSNPNVPSKLKPKTASTLKSKRKHIKHLSTLDNKAKVSKRAIPRTSQGLRQAASLSRKKARKMEKKEGYTRQRKETEKLLKADVEMRDMDGKKAAKGENTAMGKGEEAMEVD